MKIIQGLVVVASILTASKLLAPIVSPESLVWYLAAVAGIATYLMQAIASRKDKQ